MHKNVIMYDDGTHSKDYSRLYIYFSIFSFNLNTKAKFNRCGHNYEIIIIQSNYILINEYTFVSEIS